ncbi:related to Lipase [Rhynchosporium graminicola]|uniref:Related to Lipase n=1 Tax=Rhynchosporium graminicola TaxID=2792576 RepID=A0A1E1KJQ6_9HELO|nr:related to Lipase [Rhynchosporium commune]
MRIPILSVSSALLGAVAAVPMVAQRATSTTTVGISEAILQNFKLFANVTAAAYCPSNEKAKAGSLITCPVGVCPQVEADAVTAIVGFGGSNDKSVANIKGFVGLNAAKSLIVVSFAGSGATIRNWLANFSLIQIAYVGCKSCTVHSGFAKGWAERRTVILDAVETALVAHPDFKVVITGHSIGGAVGTLAAAELRGMGINADIYSYGSPRVGNAAFANFVTAQPGGDFRMTHENDPVAQIPPSWLGYAHTSPEFWLSGCNATTDVYTKEQVTVCEGVGTDGCNTKTGLIPIEGDAHNHYLGVITACQGPVDW